MYNKDRRKAGGKEKPGKTDWEKEDDKKKEEEEEGAIKNMMKAQHGRENGEITRATVGRRDKSRTMIYNFSFKNFHLFQADSTPTSHF